MLRLSMAALSVLGAAFAAAPSLAAIPGGTPVGSGDRVTGNIDGPEDRDVFLLSAPEGARLRIQVKAKGKGGLMPTLSLYAPDGSPVDLDLMLAGQGTPAVEVMDYGIPESGTWTVEVSGWLSTTGDYQASLATVVDRKVRLAVDVPAGGTVDSPFTAWDGVQVSWTAKETAGPPLAGGLVCCPHDNPVAGTEGVRKGAKLAGPRTELGQGPGRYVLRLEGSPSGATAVDLRASLKFPKAAKRRFALGDEPRPVSMSPTQGRDGTRLTLRGTGFNASSRVFIDGSHEAADPVLNGDGSLTVTCPDCPAAAAGAAAAVDVVNADGQTGRAPITFRYLGIPQPDSATPMLSALEGGVPVVIGGSRFRAGFTVNFGGVPAQEVVLQSANMITCIAPPHAEAVVDVVVYDEFGRAGATIPGFRYAAVPEVLAASPAAVPSFGGRTVSLSGAHFTPGVRVFVGGVEAEDVAVTGWYSLSFTVPPGDAGPVDVEVRDVLDRSGTGEGILAYTLSLREVAADLPAPPKGAPFLGDATAAADCDGDGDLDLVVTTATPKMNSVTRITAPSTRLLANDGAGGFTDRTADLPFPSSSESFQGEALSLGDLDADGAAEILVARAAAPLAGTDYVLYYGLPAYYLTDTPDVFDPPTLRAARVLALGDTGRFTEEGAAFLPSLSVPPAGGFGERWQAAAAAPGDLDGDGSEDLLLVAGADVRGGVVSNVKWEYKKIKTGYYPYYYYYYVKQRALFTQDTWTSGAVRPLLNDGSGYLQDRGSGPGLLLSGGKAVLDDFRGADAALGDLDGDGDLDAVSLKSAAALRDVDGTPEAASAVRVLLNMGGGYLYFEPAMTESTYAAGNPGSGDFHQGGTTALGDLDGDGDLDLLVGRAKFSYWTDDEGADRLLPALRILRNEPGSGFVEDTAGFLPDELFREGSPSTVIGVRDIALADLDGDGSLDIVVTGRESFVPDGGGGKGARGILDAGFRVATRVLLNDGKGRFSDATADWLPADPGDYIQGDAVTAFDADGDGRPEIAIVVDVAPASGKQPLRIFRTR